MKYIFTKSIYNWLLRIAPSPGPFELEMEVQVQMFFLLLHFHQTLFVSVWMGEGNSNTEFIYKNNVPYSYYIIPRLRSCLFCMRCFPTKTQTRLLCISLWFFAIFEVNDELICCLILTNSKPPRCFGNITNYLYIQMREHASETYISVSSFFLNHL